MPIPVIIDLVIAAVLGYCVVTGVRRGLFRSLMGVAGMLLFIPLTSVVYTLFREFVYKRLKEKHLTVR